MTFEDSGSYATMKEKNLALNSSMYGLLRVIEDNGNSILMDSGIQLNKNNEYEFTRTGVSRSVLRRIYTVRHISKIWIRNRRMLQQIR